MGTLILTGASRGIGHALALSLARSWDERLILVARDRARLDSLVTAIKKSGGEAIAVPGDLSSIAGARELGKRLKDTVSHGTTIIHNAGVWPSKRELTPEGFETAFTVNHLAPLVMQQPLLDAGYLRRIMVVSAGLIFKGRFDPARTPTGGDFSSIRTYCNTKLCFALAMRDVAARYQHVDVVVLHPGVVRTDLGARSGPIGWLLSLVKRGWEAPEVCAERLTRLISRNNWSPQGEARWFVEEKEQPWPAIAEDEATRNAVRETTARILASV